GEMELGSWYCPGGITAITGSNGKSTVVTLLGKILEAAGRDAVVCGNIGTPLTAVLHRITPRTEVVLEVSSFQLEETLSFHPKIGCLLNVSPNHLDRHGSLAGYRAAKARLFAWQRPGETALLNADDPACRVIGRKLPGRVVWFSRSRPVVGSVLQGGHLRVTLPDGSGTICASTELPKQGLPHEENGLAAGALAALLGVPPDLTGRVLRAFPGLPHRQQPVSTIHGVTFINDSKATTLEAGIGAIESMPGPVVLIAGGRDKGSDFRPLARLVGKLKAAVLIGEDGPKIGVPLKGRVPLHRAADMAEAVRKAFDLAAERGVVLLSPMCTSFDMFRDFEERGDRFIEAVRRLESPAAAPLGAGG
ncbi:MAG: UDP-N-acetylmuramoyl-L-alanine--D-glutamate ligase, partial [Candidatus Omnitrophica bacterium CG11_big_fil_rev_8_21_14_0_20_64_10]